MKVAIAGATGFIGSFLLDLLNNDEQVTSVQILSRRALPLSEKSEMHMGDLEDWVLPGIDVAFCALGTTIATAGSKEAFYKVDHDMVIRFAEKAKQAGAGTFVMVSSIGADAKAGSFYLKVKGETEEDLKELGFRSLIILRPSILMGNRKEFRFGERIGKGVMTILNPLMIGSLRKYKGIHGKTVAKAMLKLANEDLPGVHILESDTLLAFS